MEWLERPYYTFDMRVIREQSAMKTVSIKLPPRYRRLGRQAIPLITPRNG